MLLWRKRSEQTSSPEQTTGRTKSSPTEKCTRLLRWQCPSCSPILKVEKPHLHTVAACDRPQTTEIPKLPPNPEVVWQQPLDKSTNQCTLNNTNEDSTKHYTQETSKMTVASQTSPPKGTQPQNYVVASEHPPVNQTGNEPVSFLNHPKNCPTDIQKSEQHVMATIFEGTTIPRLTTTTLVNEEGFVRDEETNDLYLPLTSTVVLKPKNRKCSK